MTLDNAACLFEVTQQQTENREENRIQNAYAQYACMLCDSGQLSTNYRYNHFQYNRNDVKFV